MADDRQERGNVVRTLRARVDAVLIQAVIAASLSFAHLHDIASAAGQSGWKSWAYPVSVDLLLVAAWRRLRSGGGKGAGWCWFLVALTASLGANVATAGLLDLSAVPAWLRILVAGWPAVAFLGGTLLAHNPMQTAAVAATEQATAEPSTAGPSPRALPAVDALQHSAQVPAALLRHARKVADAHRAATGSAIDTATLRNRLGVSVPLAEAIAAHLT
jgi:hypothetical protein